MLTFKRRNFVKDISFNHVKNIIDNGGLCLNITHGINYQKYRLETFKKILSIINEEVDAKDKLIDFLSKESKTFNLKSHANYAKNLFEIIKNEKNPEKIFLEQEEVRYVFLDLLPCGDKYNMYAGYRKYILLNLTHMVIKNHNLLEIIKMSIDAYREEAKTCKPGVRKGLFKSYVKYGKEIHYVLSRTIDNFNENTSDKDIIKSLLMASKEYKSKLKTKPQKYLILIIENSVYGMLHNNKENIEKRIYYATQLLKLLKKYYNDCNDKLLTIVNYIRIDAKFISFVNDHNSLSNYIKQEDINKTLDDNFLDFIENNIYNNPNYENCLLEYIEDQNLMKVILSYSDNTMKETEQEIFINSLRNKPDKVEELFNRIIKDATYNDEDFDKVTNALWFRDISLLAAKCMKNCDFEECKNLLDTSKELMESIFFLVSKKLRTEKEAVEKKLSKMSSIISILKGNPIFKSSIDNIYGSIKTKINRMIDEEEKDDDMNSVLIDRELMEYVDDLKLIIEENLNSEEKYQEYARFENLRNYVCECIINNNLEDRQYIVKKIITTMLNWKDDKINAVEYEIENYKNTVERRISCQNDKEANDYRRCLIKIKRLHRLVSLVSDYSENYQYLIIDEDFIDSCIKIEVAIHFLYEKVLKTSDEISNKKIDYAKLIKNIFNDKKYNKYLDIDDFIKITEENSNDWLEYYEKINDENNFEWRKNIIEHNDSYNKTLLKEFINNSEKARTFDMCEILRNLIYNLGALAKKDDAELNEMLSFFIKESNQYFELFKEIFDLTIKEYNRAIAIEDKTNKKSNYHNSLNNIIKFKNIIIPITEITKDLELNDNEAKELTDNFIKIETAINYLVHNNLSAEDNVILKKLEYIDYIQVNINKPLVKNVVEVILDVLKNELDSLINKYQNEYNDYELIFKSNEKKYLDTLKSIIDNNDYENYKNSEIIRSKIYSIAILNCSSPENVKPLIVKIKNFPNGLLDNIVDNFIFIRRCMCGINSDKITEDEVEEYKKQIASLEKWKEKILVISKNSIQVDDIYKLIDSYDKLNEYIDYIVTNKSINIIESINKKIEYIQNIENILLDNNYTIILTQIVKNLRNNLAIASNEYAKNNDKSDTESIKYWQISENIDEFETNLLNPTKLKNYLKNYKIKEEIKRLIILILQGKDEYENTKELVKIALKDKKLVLDIFNCNLPYMECSKAEGDYILVKNLVKNKVLAITNYIKRNKNNDEFCILFKKVTELYSTVKQKIKILTKNIANIHSEKSYLYTYFYDVCNIFYTDHRSKMIFLCAMKDVAVDYKSDMKNTDFPVSAKLAELSSQKIYELLEKVKKSKNKDKFLNYIKEYEIIGYMSSTTNYYYNDDKVKLINNYINDKQLCEKIFDYVSKEIEKYDTIRNIESNSNYIIDLRNFTIRLVDEVKDISDINERTEILYKKYFLKDYVGWNIYFELWYGNLLKFDENNIKERINCIHKNILLIKKYHCESQIDDILAVAKSKFKEEINKKITDRRNGAYFLYQDNISVDIFNELCDNIENKFLTDEKYLYDYFMDERVLSYFHNNWINNGNYIENKRYFVIETIKDKNRIDDLFNRYIRGYTQISKEYYLDSDDNYKYKVAIRRAEELRKEIFEVVEKVKDIEDRLEQESMINAILITEKELKESFDNTFRFNETLKYDIDFVDWNIGRLINLGFYYKNGKKEILDKIFKDKYDEIEISLNNAKNICEETNPIFDKIQLSNLVEALNGADINYSNYCQIDKKIMLLIRLIMKETYCEYSNPDTVMSEWNDNISYHKGSMIKELIYIIKQYGINEFARVTDNILDIIDIAYKYYKEIKPAEINNNHNFYINIVRVLSNNITKIYQLLEQTSKDYYEFRAKLNDIVLSLELLSQLEYDNTNYFHIPIVTVQIKTILDKLRNIVDRNSKDIFNIAADIIISENQVYYEAIDDNYTIYFNPMELFKEIKKEIIGE